MIARFVSLAVVVAAAIAGLAFVGHAATAQDDQSSDRFVYLEAEGMLPALESFAGPASGLPEQAIARRQANCCGVLWSGNAQVLFENHTPGNRMTLRFEVPESGTYAVSVAFTRAPDFGVYEFTVDGRPIVGRFGAARFDGYSPQVERSEPVAIGHVALAEGSHTLTLTVPEKNSASSNYFAGLDYIELRGDGN